jgi:hypothetical protein
VSAHSAANDSPAGKFERPAIERSWLDEQLVGKVDGFGTQEAVSFGLIALKKSGKIDYESVAAPSSMFG